VTQATGNLTNIVSRVDLNQLVSLDALLRERSVTKAAAALGLTQPALSASLGRLRRYFNDDLLRRVGNSYELTPLAVLLAERTTTALTAAGEVFRSQTRFDPVESDREFQLYLSDYATSVLAPTLARLTRVEAPHVRVRIRQLTVTAVENADTVLREHDGMVVPHGFIENMPNLDLFRDTYTCLVSADNHVIGEELTADDLTGTPMVTAYMASSGGNTALRHLRMAGVEPHLETVTESFLTVPFLIAGTDRIGLVPALLAHRIGKLGEVRAVACPFPTGELVEALWWHRTQHNDQAHRWFRDAVRRAATTVPAD
jgi:DNA-binding transcriptional LysR family regulator